MAIMKYIEKGEKDMDNVEDLLGIEIRRSILNLETLTFGSQEHSAAVESVNKLYRLRVDSIKQSQENEQEERLKEERVIDRRIKICLEAAKIGVPIVFYGIWMRRGLKFEETGTFTSKVFNGLHSRFKPTI